MIKLNPITSNSSGLYNTTRAIADGLRKPFYNWRSHGTWTSFALAIIFKAPIMILGLVLSLPFRQISIWSSPGQHVVTSTSEKKAKKVTDKVTILSYNILGMPSYHAAKEQRKGISERINEAFKVIDGADADVVMLQEVHAGSALEEKIMTNYADKYSTFYRDMGQKVFFLGSGLMVFTKLKNTTFTFERFNQAAELPTKKGIGVLTIKDGDDAVLRIANTHFQSGKSEYIQAIRQAQTEQIIAFADRTPKVPFFFGGDLNIDRNGDEYIDEHPLHHTQEKIRDGFQTDEERKKATLADFEGTSEPAKLAVDNILGINAGDWKISIEQRGSFDNKDESPSDHAAMLATLTRD